MLIERSRNANKDEIRTKISSSILAIIRARLIKWKIIEKIGKNLKEMIKMTKNKIIDNNLTYSNQSSDKGNKYHGYP